MPQITTKLPLFEVSGNPHFDGETYDPALDQERLASQFERVKRLMLDGKWRTYSEIRDVVGGEKKGDMSTSISARLRDLRKEKYGSYIVDKRRRGDPSRGLFEYRVLPSKEAASHGSDEQGCRAASNGSRRDAKSSRPD